LVFFGVGGVEGGMYMAAGVRAVYSSKHQSSACTQPTTPTTNIPQTTPTPTTNPPTQVRAGLAALGLRSLDELIGRADLLRQRPDLKLAKTAGLNLSFLTTFAGPSESSSARRVQEVHSNGPVLDDVILADKEVVAAIEAQGSVRREYEIINTDRSALARVSGEIAKRYGDSGFKGAWGGGGWLVGGWCVWVSCAWPCVRCAVLCGRM